MNPLRILREWARNQILAGVQDALAAVTPEGEEPPESLLQLRERAAVAALPDAEPRKEVGRKRN